jgi:Uma2 family endonuclease
MGEAGLLDHPWITRRKLDVGQYHRLAEAGILGEDDRVELIEGELIEMMPIGSPHAGAVNTLNELLVPAVAGKAVVAVQNPVRLDDRSEPQPDFALLKSRPDRYRRATPTPADVLLLIEVADTSGRYDRVVKLPLCARHKIPEVWIVDVENGAIEVHREPDGDRYRRVSRPGRDEVLSPELLPDVRLMAATILG